MHVDLNDSDGVIAATCNIPDSLWTSTVQAAAVAAATAHGFTVDASDPDDTIDPHVQTITDQTSLLNWINMNAYSAGATGPSSSSTTATPAAAAPADDGTTGAVVAALAVAAVAGLAWLASSGALGAREPKGRGDRMARTHRAFAAGRGEGIHEVSRKRWIVTRHGEPLGHVEKLADGSWRVLPSSRSPLPRRQTEDKLADAATALHRRGA